MKALIVDGKDENTYLLDIILRSPAQEAVLAALCRRAAGRLKAWSGPGVTIGLRLFDFAGQELYSTKI